MNWKTIVKNLNEQMSLREIAQAIDVSPTTLHALMHGRQKSLNWEAGQRLIVLALQRGKL